MTTCAGTDHGVVADAHTREHDDTARRATRCSPIVIGSPPSSLSRRGCASIGCVGVSSCTFGPIWQSAPIRIGATSRAVKF